MERHHTCLDCSSFVAFSAAECAQIGEMGEIPLSAPLPCGVCVLRTNQSARMFRALLSEPVFDCNSFCRGSFRESLDVACPLCCDGRLEIHRDRIGADVRSVIRCSNRPKCLYERNRLLLKTPCRFCGRLLVLSVGAELRIGCPECGKSTVAIGLVRSWPALFSHTTTCGHGLPLRECKICSHSREARESVFQLEFEVAKLIGDRLQDAGLRQVAAQASEDAYESSAVSGYPCESLYWPELDFRLVLENDLIDFSRYFPPKYANDEVDSADDPDDYPQTLLVNPSFKIVHSCTRPLRAPFFSCIAPFALLSYNAGAV